MNSRKIISIISRFKIMKLLFSIIISLAFLGIPNLQTDFLQNVNFSENVNFTFDRSASFDRLKDKIEKGETVSIHIRIPLCDNDYQGVVPVPAKLGNGKDLRNNLYWGAKYGFKSYFKNYTDWTLVSAQKDM